MAGSKNNANQSSPNKTKKPNKKKKIWKIIGITCFILVAMLVTGCGAGAAYMISQIKDAPALDLKKFTSIEATTFIYDRNNQLLGQTQGDGNRELIKSLSDVSQPVVNAFISGEDKNFYTHMGINPVAMVRAVFQDLLHHGYASGASTITQQTVKNVMFPEGDKTIKRKVQEAYYAIKLEQVMNKDEILTTYLNWIYFGQSESGQNLYGIQAASKAFFGIPSNKLNVAQAALIASLPNDPADLNPYSNLPNAIVRQNYMLGKMRDNGYINDQQLADAKAFDIKASLVKSDPSKSSNSAHPYVETDVEQRAVDALFSTKQFDNKEDAKKALDSGGYQVYTTIDLKMQNSVENVIQNDANFGAGTTISVTGADGKTVKEYEQAGASLIDNKTGGILAIGGGRNFNDDQNNHTLLPRQPGSTMKPIADYGPAIDKKLIFPGMGIDDVPTVWPGGAGSKDYTPFNYDFKFHGLISVRSALIHSFNIPAIKIFQKLTPQVGLSYVKKMGITTLTDQDNVLSSAIGGLSQGVTVEEQTSAFSTFADQGVHKDAFVVDHIVDRRGNVIYQHQSTDTKVFTPQTAFIMTDMLKDVVHSYEGTAYSVGTHFPGKTIAGKTGTTDSNKDAWFVGYTPDVSLGIWVGYNTPTALPSTPSYSEGNRPKDLWNAMMDQIYPLIPNQATQFAPAPAGVQQAQVCILSGKLPTDLDKQYSSQYGSVISTDWFTSDMVPTQPDDVVVQLKYTVVNGKKVFITDPKTLVGGPVKEGLFIKRSPYTLINNDPQYLPPDYDREYISSATGTVSSTGGAGGSTSVASPADLQATVGSDGSVTLTWSAIPGADGYYVLRSNAAGQSQIITQDMLTKPGYVDKSITSGGSFAYQVSAVVNGIIQPAGSTATVSVGQSGGAKGGGTSGAAPAGVTVSQGPTGPHLSWNTVKDAQIYNIYRSSDGTNFTLIDSTKATQYDDPQLVQGGKLTYQVTAVTPSGESPQSVPVTLNSGAGAGSGGSSGGGIGAPSPAISNPHTGSDLDLSWKAVPNAASYVVEKSMDGSVFGSATQVSGVSYRDSGLTAGTKYYYRIRAVNSQGVTSDPSAVVNSVPST
ncbi:MAG: hypothetical protein JWN30_1548 [Bacilli bacterium]|nr:hypothetical protein [Bacilli bacterium]